MARNILPRFKLRKTDVQNTGCITDNKGFRSVCLDNATNSHLAKAPAVSQKL